MIDPRTLTDDALIASVERLARIERETSAGLIAHLVVMEERNLHLACGFSSLFLYCRKVLHFSDGGAYDRQQAARAARRFPVILALLAGGRLHLTAVRLLAPHLKDEDHLALLGGAIHKSTEKVRELLAGWFPQADVPASVRRVPARRRGSVSGTAPVSVTAPVSATTPPLTNEEPDAPAEAPSSTLPGAAAEAQGSREPADQPNTLPEEGAGRPPRPAPVPQRPVAPLAPGRHLFKFTGDDETVALLREAQELLSHSLPNGDVAAIVKRGLAMVVAEARRQRHAATSRPQAPPRDGDPGDAVSRTVFADVQRVVWDRDGGQCGFVSADGRRCEERRFLEFHHLRPWIVGGPPSAVNISLRCRAHNQYEAQVYFAPIREAMSERVAQSPGLDGSGNAGREMRPRRTGNA